MEELLRAARENTMNDKTFMPISWDLTWSLLLLAPLERHIEIIVNHGQRSKPQDADHL